MGPVGYVVTFRQTDPPYALDLSDPARPRVRGAVALTGYSAYLHPASGTRLIGSAVRRTRWGMSAARRSRCSTSPIWPRRRGWLSAGRGTVVVLEHMHRADRETLAVRECLAGHVTVFPVAVVITARSDEPGTSGLNCSVSRGARACIPLAGYSRRTGRACCISCTSWSARWPVHLGKRGGLPSRHCGA